MFIVSKQMDVTENLMIAPTLILAKGQMGIAIVFCSKHRSKLLEIQLFCRCQTGVPVERFGNVKPKQRRTLSFFLSSRFDWIKKRACIITPLIHSFRLVLSSTEYTET